MTVAAAALQTQQATHAGTGIFTIVLSEYLDRGFSSTSPPEDAPKVDGEPIQQMRELKRLAKYQKMQNEQAWKEASVSDKHPWQNKLAFELSIALERIGIAVFTGVVPANVFLALAADQVLDDWSLCEAWVENHQMKEDARDPEFGVHFHRRHAEWLFLFSALWMCQTFPKYPPLAKASDKRPRLKEDFLKLTSLESSLMPPLVRTKIAEMLKFKPCELR